MPSPMKFHPGAKDEDKLECVVFSKVFLEFLVDTMKVSGERLHIEFPITEGNLLTE